MKENLCMFAYVGFILSAIVREGLMATIMFEQSLQCHEKNTCIAKKQLKNLLLPLELTHLNFQQIYFVLPHSTSKYNMIQ